MSTIRWPVFARVWAIHHIGDRNTCGVAEVRHSIRSNLRTFAFRILFPGQEQWRHSEMVWKWLRKHTGKILNYLNVVFEIRQTKAFGANESIDISPTVRSLMSFDVVFGTDIVGLIRKHADDSIHIEHFVYPQTLSPAHSFRPSISWTLEKCIIDSSIYGICSGRFRMIDRRSHNTPQSISRSECKRSILRMEL